MRSIWFKAKCLSDGSWVAGNFCHRATGDYIILGECMFAIDPETVCQFTGLRDNNGVDVYENDIIQDHEFGDKGTVVWNDITCGFIEEASHDGISLLVKCMGWCVVGNKFDRKEGEG